MDCGNLTHKRITVFAGHYGSGKTNIAVNFALWLKKDGLPVALADLDIVNPYFRAKDSEDALELSGVRVISSEYANSNVDTPAIPPEIYSVFQDRSTLGVIDVGGDDRGALALGRYSEYLLEENDYDFLFVINKYRYLTGDAESTVEVMREIEKASGVKFTGIVNNSNLGEETTADTVLNSVEYAQSVSDLTGLDIKLTTVKSDLFDELCDKVKHPAPIELYVRQSWLKNNNPIRPR